jgi:hypothetical protein
MMYAIPLEVMDLAKKDPKALADWVVKYQDYLFLSQLERRGRYAKV